jgi:hypothetical protein
LLEIHCASLPLRLAAQARPGAPRDQIFRLIAAGSFLENPGIHLQYPRIAAGGALSGIGAPSPARAGAMPAPRPAADNGLTLFRPDPRLNHKFSALIAFVCVSWSSE